MSIDRAALSWRCTSSIPVKSPSPLAQEELLDHPAPVAVETHIRRGRTVVDHVQPTHGTSLVQYLLRHTRWILLSAVLVTGLSALFLWSEPSLYSSSIVILTDQQLPIEAENGFAKGRSNGGSKLYYLATSTAMFDHLIDHFDLYDHFGLDPSAPWAYEQASGMLLRNIAAQDLGDGSMLITVRDKDRVMARDMANEVYAELQRTVARIALHWSEKNVALYEAIVAGTSERIDEQSAALRALAAQLAEEEDRAGRAKQFGTKDERTLSGKIDKLAAEITLVHHDLARALRTNEIALAMEREEHIPELYLARSALLDISTSPNLSRTLTLVSVFMLMLFLGVVLVTIWRMHRDDVHHYLHAPVIR
ncbi:MAG: hypothetical protein R2818_04500 [Flavobacteriales bacterium]